MVEVFLEESTANADEPCVHDQGEPYFYHGQHKQPGGRRAPSG